MRSFYYWMIANLGINPKAFLSFFRYMPAFFLEYVKVKRMYKGRVDFVPYVTDKNSAAGSFLHEYFIQDVFAAQFVHRLNPVKVVDVGSRIDGYIAQLISFRQVELIDIRPVNASIQNLSFLQMDFSNNHTIPSNYTDFISCLHSIEHFGLGRYGDPIHLDAVPAALQNFHTILKPGGTFLLSTTVGEERIAFNKQWIFDINKMAGQLQQSGFTIAEIFALQEYHFKSVTIGELALLTSAKDVLVILICRKN